MKILYIPEFEERYEIKVSDSIDGTTTKSVTGTSLGEAETSQVLLRDIEINTENPEDLIEIFDYLEYNGYIDKILKAIPKKERDAFNKYFNDSLTELINHKNSIAGAIEVLADTLPTIMENLNEIKDDLADTDLTLVKDIYNKLENK